MRRFLDVLFLASSSLLLFLFFHLLPSTRLCPKAQLINVCSLATSVSSARRGFPTSEDYTALFTPAALTHNKPSTPLPLRNSLVFAFSSACARLLLLLFPPCITRLFIHCFTIHPLNYHVIHLQRPRSRLGRASFLCLGQALRHPPRG